MGVSFPQRLNFHHCMLKLYFVATYGHTDYAISVTVPDQSLSHPTRVTGFSYCQLVLTALHNFSWKLLLAASY